MKFSPVLEPYLLNLKEKYTKYKIGYVLNFKSEFSFRLYELMKSYETIGERTLTIEEIRELFMLEDTEYVKYTHLRTRVIDKALNEINKYSDLKVEIIKEEKEGKKIVGLVFEINTNNYRTPIEHYEEYNNYLSKTKAELQQILSNMIEKRYKQELFNYKTDLFSKETIVQLVIDLKNNMFEDNAIKHPVPYFIKVLQEKEKEITGKEITHTEIRKHEISILSEKI